MAATSNSKSLVQTEFAKDVLKGLNSTPKHLSSKYFYDERGDKLFQEIMNMPEYYLTNAEFEILDRYKAELLQLIGDQHFDLVELGAGDGTKTKILLRHFLEEGADFTYNPIDISRNVLLQLEEDLKNELPKLDFSCLEGDYFAMLEQLQFRSQTQKVILFLGGNIGNLTLPQAQAFISQLFAHMDPGNLLITGFDLKKDPEIILKAYNDPAGITAAFNLNLLRRINEELDANFEPDQFKHWESYNPVSGATKSYIVSKKRQKVYLGALEQMICFDAWEAIDVELSQKFSLQEIELLARETGFRVVRHLTDSRSYFVDSVWQK